MRKWLVQMMSGLLLLEHEGEQTEGNEESISS